MDDVLIMKKTVIIIIVIAALAAMSTGYKWLFPGEYKPGKDEIAMKIRLDIRTERIAESRHLVIAPGQRTETGIISESRPLPTHAYGIPVPVHCHPLGCNCP